MFVVVQLLSFVMYYKKHCFES